MTSKVTYNTHNLLNKSKELIKKTSPAGWFYIASLLATAIPIAILYSLVDDDPTKVNGSLINCIFLGLADGALLLIPYWWIKRRRWLTLVPVWLSGIFVEINLINLQWCTDLISFKSIFMLGNVDATVTDNLPQLIHADNYAIAFILFAYTIGYFCLRRKINASRFNTGVTRKAIIFSLLAFIADQALIHTYWYASLKSQSVKVSFLNIPARMHSWPCYKHSFSYRGYPLYTIIESTSLLESRNLSDADRKNIDTYLASTDTPTISHPEFNENRQKNLIIIVVESLCAHAITAEASGQPVMPTLASLINDEGSISALNVVSQIKDGISGDGQMLINTGLLPLIKGSAALEYTSTTELIGLPYIMHDRNSVAVLSEHGSTWNVKNAYTSYGFHPTYTCVDYTEDKYVADSTMMNYASSLLPTLIDNPFLLEMVTLSMHTPFNQVKAPMPQWIAQSDYSDTRKAYYHTCNFFDRSLARFIENLKSLGIWDDTILVTVSDHSIHTDESGAEAMYCNIPMAFVATNTGVTHCETDVVGQVDLFPTIIDIMGFYQDGSRGAYSVDGTHQLWRGLGKSFLSPGYINAAIDPQGRVHGDAKADVERLQKSLRVSNDIIRGNYFKDKIIQKPEKQIRKK